MGCFLDDGSGKLLSGSSFKFPDRNSPEECIDVCLRLGFQTAAVQYKEECHCGWMREVEGRGKLADFHCNKFSCPANPKSTCGGVKALAVYNTGLGGKYHQTASYVNVGDRVGGRGDYKGVRVVFLVQLNGRASRQVRRLLKLIYRPWHFYYIHVDSRQDFMYREMLELEQKISATSPTNNFRVKRNRFATIWGGASLLDMILDSIQDLIKLWPRPSWDFLLNLSETDFPILSIEELEALLGKYKGFSFLRSHGNSTKKFITKQGLDRVFVECEQRMWRVGERDLPKGIRIDGGSDWVVLDREFAEFAATSKENVVESLRQLFRHALLPAESFFHTVAGNTKFCTKVINSNLKLTNWRRRQGCKCQYKHIVDWCGCSPSVFVADLDWPRLERPTSEKRLYYFARKFEPIIDQRVVALAESQSSRYSDFERISRDQVFDSYWQNEYHWSDKSPMGGEKPANSMLMKAVGRMAYRKLNLHKNCQCGLGEPKEMNLYKKNDEAEIELLVKIPVVCSGEMAVLVEILVERKQFWTSFGSLPGWTLNSLEVGAVLDLKEQIFRNYAGAIGQRKLSPTLRHAWSVNRKYLDVQVPAVSVIWLDPEGMELGDRETSQDLKGETRVYHSTLELESLEKKSLKPGVWVGKLVTDEMTIGETRFGVFPDETDDLKLADALTREFYALKNICKVSEEGVRSRNFEENCGALFSLPRCVRLKWSSEYPDSKSDVKFGYDKKFRQLI